MFPTLIDTREGTLVLFSSRRQMVDVYDGLGSRLGIDVLMQGDYSKQEILRRHREAIDAGEGSVIFGLASFAEGVDLPGDYCRHVVIAKIPFAVPDSPLEASLAEWVEAQGRNPFMEISVPDAALRLVQASGRLLRTEQDTGRVTLMDRQVAQIVKRLKDEKVLNNTAIFFFTDHGISHARGKQFLYEEGAHIPLVISGPGVPSGTTRTDLVEHIDVAALSLAAAGIEIPKKMQGQDILSENHVPKVAVFAARDRCGEAADRIRSVRTDRYLYVKNFYPNRPLLMPSGYKDAKLILKRLRELHATGQTSELTNKLLFAPTRPPEELYLYQQDRWQTKNLADDPDHKSALLEHRQRLNRWIETTGDLGPESLEVYIMETDDQMKSTRNATARETYRKNTELYKRWYQEEATPHNR